MLRESVNRESTKQHLVFHGSSFGGLYKSSYVIIFTVFRNKNAKQTPSNMFVERELCLEFS